MMVQQMISMESSPAEIGVGVQVPEVVVDLDPLEDGAVAVTLMMTMISLVGGAVVRTEAKITGLEAPEVAVMIG